MKRIDAIFYDRKSYEMMLGMDQAEIKNLFANVKSYVFSNTITKPYDGTELVSGNFVKNVQAIKVQVGKDI